MESGEESGLGDLRVEVDQGFEARVFGRAEFGYPTSCFGVALLAKHIGKGKEG